MISTGKYKAISFVLIRIIATIIWPTLCMIAPIILTVIFENLFIFLSKIIKDKLSTAPAKLYINVIRLLNSILESINLNIETMQASFIPILYNV